MVKFVIVFFLTSDNCQLCLVSFFDHQYVISNKKNVRIYIIDNTLREIINAVRIEHVGKPTMNT